MRHFITADIHFGHSNIIKYCPDSRPFETSEEMDEKIISNWNSVVTNDDCTYIVGDVAFCNATKASELLNRLNGLKILVIGNHDHKLVHQDIFRECFIDINDYLEIYFDKTFVKLFHYPIESWNGMNQGSIHLHGHKHGSLTKTNGKIKDIGMDTNDLFPYLLSDVITKMKERLILHLNNTN